MEQLEALSLPPGFGFHPTDVELVSHYLKRKVLGQRIELGLIPELDIYKHEPWDLSSKYTSHKSDTKWYFFTARDRKYPTGARSNRTTRAGYWKSTGKDRIIKQNNRVVGSKKTLVFHQGRPPAGKRTEWIMHEYYLDESECKDAPDAKDLFVLCRITKRDGCSTDADTPASAEVVVPNEVEQSSGVVDPVVHDDVLSPSENVVVSSNNNNNDDNNGQQDDVESWLKQLFSSSESSLLGPQFSPEPFGPIPAALKREPNGGFLREGSAEETSFLLPDDIQSILGTHDHENTQNLQFLEDETTGTDDVSFCNFVGYNNGDDETGIVLRRRSTTASYDYPNDTDGSTINKYNLKSKLQVHLYKKEEKSLETASFTPKDGLVGEFENSEKIKGMNRKEPKSTMMPKRAKTGGFLGTSTLIFTAVLVAGIATLFCSLSNNCSIFS